MATNTKNLALLKKDVATDGNDTFNIKTMLNENWDKIDVAFGKPVYGNEIHGLRINVNKNIEYYNTELREWVEVKSGVDGAPIQSYNYKIPATSDGQTDFQIPLATFDPEIDVMLVMQNRTVLEDGDYTVTHPDAHYYVKLVAPVKDYVNMSLSLFIIKGNVMVSDIVELPAASIKKVGIVGLTNNLGTSETLAVTQKALNTVATAKADKSQVTASLDELTRAQSAITTTVGVLTTAQSTNTSSIGELKKANTLSIEKSGKDENGLYTTVTYKRKPEGTVFATSVLSGGESPLYTTRTLKIYNAVGSQVDNTLVYTLTYDDDGELIGEA